MLHHNGEHARTQRPRLPSCRAQPDPPLSASQPASAEQLAARDAANFRPLNLNAILLIRITMPFLSRAWTERLYETVGTSMQMTKMTQVLISAGSSSTRQLILQTLALRHLFRRPARYQQSVRRM